MGLLVIGWGNELRGDDRAGRVVADRIEGSRLPGVTVRSVIQLVPELAVDVAAADQVVFVDADIDVSSLVVRRIEPTDEGPGATTHRVTPESLVALAVTVGGRRPLTAELVSVPAIRFDPGAPVSAVTEQATERAIQWIVERAGTNGPMHGS